MTANPNALLCDYAKNAPENFANNLESATTEEIFEVLADLPNKSAAAVLARLQPYKIAGALDETTPLLLDWLADGELEDVKSVLIHLPHSSRSALVRKLPNGSHRLALQRFLNYPDHSLGRFVSNAVLCVPVAMSTLEVIQLIKSHASGMPVLAVSGSGKYVGILDARQVLEGNHAAPVKKYLSKVPPLRAESTLVDAMEAMEWEAHSVLPVVDHDNQVLGVMRKAELMVHLGQSSEKTRPLDSLLAVFQLYMNVLVSMLDTVFKIRKQR